MAWYDDLLPAELNGVPFFYRSIGGRGGRRNTVYEFPNRDDIHVEDLGKLARKYKVAAFIIGTNYHLDRDRLIDVLDAGGAMTFQHPYLGPLPVQLDGEFNWSESDTEGGWVQFDFTLVQAGLAFPLIRVATASKVSALAAIAAETLSAKTKFSLLGAIGDVINSVTNAIGKANSALRKVNGKINAGLSLADNLTAAINEFDDQLTKLMNTPGVLMNKLLALKSAVMGLVKDFIPPTTDTDVIGFVPSAAKAAIEAMTTLLGTVQAPSAIPTPTQQFVIESAAIAAVDLVDKAGTAIYAADALANVELESSVQALAIQATLVEAMEDILAAPGLDPEIIESMSALKAATIAHFSAQAAALPKVRQHVVQSTVPALVLAYQEYGDASRDLEIVRRNGVRHPGFVPGGTTMELLTDD